MYLPGGGTFVAISVLLGVGHLKLVRVNADERVIPMDPLAGTEHLDRAVRARVLDLGDRNQRVPAAGGRGGGPREAS